MSSALVIILRQRAIADRFRSAGATMPAGARPLSEMGVRPGRLFARMSAFDLGVALQDEGVPDSAATKTWQAVGDNYNKLVESCWKAKCGAAGSPKK